MLVANNNNTRLGTRTSRVECWLAVGEHFGRAHRMGKSRRADRVSRDIAAASTR